MLPIRDLKETAINYFAHEKTATFYTQEKKWITKIKWLAETHPDEVTIVYETDEGSLMADIPKSWFKLSPPRKRTLTEEQRNAAAERMRKLAQKKKENN